MTNLELLETMKKQLNPTYQIGLHSVCVGTYKENAKNQKYYINKKNVTEEDIIFKILKDGLNVPEFCIGLRSTVKLKGNINSLTADDFNYGYWFNYSGISNDKVYNLIIAIPSYININEKEYFIGDETNFVNIATYSLFYSLLPKEFIYGYYIKEYDTTKEYDPKIEKIIFDEKLEFISNLNFYDYLPNKETYWLNYFKENKLKLSLLEAANYPTILNNLFQNCRNKHAIKLTKERIKELKRTRN